GLLGEFWHQVRDEFPIVETQPPYEMPIETLADEVQAETARVELLESLPIPRLWFRSEDGTQLLQVQSNWFAFNWQSAGGDAPYPRYPAVEERFLRYVRMLVEFLEVNGVGDVGPTQCEVTYINHITLAPGASFDDVLTLTSATSHEFLPAPAQHRHVVVYPMTTPTGDRFGRLHIASAPGVRRTDNVPILGLNLTARGFPLGHGEDGILGFMRLGREWVVRGFADVTSARMHEIWGRRA
ncbi:MAG: TIGR04255 family protein, partial [Acidimicrobiales bacterium]|nr:TIGR04255 family protein [Acidimicrobiales bacterium]